MPLLPDSLTELIRALNSLPGIGPRSAERLALYLVQTEAGVARHLAAAILLARERVRFCEVCGAFAEGVTCTLCADVGRDQSVLCVVERPVDILPLEKSATFRGKYHVLGGTLSPLNGVEPEDLRISALEQRLRQEPIREIIMALGTDVEGDATSHYLAEVLAREGLAITRLAHGLPAGSGLEFADELTLSRALEGRRQIN